MSPRILLADTIGFIDELPSDLLDAFHATLDESLECDLLLLLVDSSDNIDELKRKLSTSRREIFDRMEALPPKIKLVLTKSDNMQDIDEALDFVNTIGMQDPIVISSHTEHGISDLRQCILESLYGGETSVYVADDENSTVSSESLISKIYNLGIVTNRHGNELVIWCDRGELNRLISKSNGRISIK
jgi:GTP-binding protein HflX